jgi:hypothetical protein
VLGNIAFYCKDNDLSLITALVIEKGSGRPGDRIPIDPARIDEERENVYQYDSYNIHPPSEAELGAAYEKHHSSRQRLTTHLSSVPRYRPDLLFWNAATHFWLRLA